MVKCFWCGAENDRRSHSCHVCKRKLQWTAFFNGMLRPSAGCLVGARPTGVDQQHLPRLRMAL